MYKRKSVYPNGQPIPESLPESYQPSSYGNAPSGQSCFTCKNFNMTTRYCSAWNAPVKPRWWCEGWESSLKPTQSQTSSVLTKKITTSSVEEHFSEILKPSLKSTQADYYGFDDEYENENEEDVIRVNVPLMIRLLEYAREDAEKDIDLHSVTERLIELSEEGKVLEMKDYESIVNDEL